jgi:GH24 family phage-related lysozyme (muramidase)
MHDSVRAAFREFNKPFEGVVHWMYLDVRGLVTIGVGNLIDPVEVALALPFHSLAAPGTVATEAQISEEWRRIKGDPTLATKGFRACESITQLRLDDTAVDSLIASRLTENEALLKKELAFAQFDSWPADAQLGLLSMAWALGAGGPSSYPHFQAACRKLDFAAAAEECTISEQGNAGVAPRNRANRTLFRNAAAIMAGGGYDSARLYYPSSLGPVS